MRITKTDLEIIKHETLEEFVKNSDDISYKLRFINDDEDMASVIIEGKKKNANTVWHIRTVEIEHESADFTSTYEINNGLYKLQRKKLMKAQHDNLNKMKEIRRKYEGLEEVAETMGLTLEQVLSR